MSTVEFISGKVTTLLLATFQKRIPLQSSLRISPFILNKANEIYVSKKMSVQRSSFLHKLLSASCNLLKKSSTVGISKVFSKSFETKQIKKLYLPSELFQENVYDKVYFWKNYRLQLPTLTQVNSTVAIYREFSKKFETITKNVSSFRNVYDGIISGNITGSCSVFSLKKKEFCCCCFRSSYRTCSLKKGVHRNFAQFTGKHLCHSIFLNKVTGRRLQIYFKKKLRCFPVNCAKFLRTSFVQNTYR